MSDYLDLVPDHAHHPKKRVKVCARCLQELNILSKQAAERIADLEAELAGLQSRAGIAQRFRDDRIAALESELAEEKRGRREAAQLLIGLWCPKCSSPEWFPGASCFACGWEGSAFDAYEEVTRKIAALEAELAEARDAAHLAHPDATKHGGIVGAIEFLRAEKEATNDE